MRTMLKLTSSEEIGAKEAWSPAITMQRLYDNLPLAIDWSQAELEDRLEYLYRDPLEIVTRSHCGHQHGWAVNLKVRNEP